MLSGIFLTFCGVFVFIAIRVATLIENLPELIRVATLIENRPELIRVTTLIENRPEFD